MPTFLIRRFFNWISITFQQLLQTHVCYENICFDISNWCSLSCQWTPNKFRVSYNWNLLKYLHNGFLIFSAKYFCKCFLIFLATVYVRNLRVVGCSTVYGVSLQNNCAPQNRAQASCKGQGSGQCCVGQCNQNVMHTTKNIRLQRSMCITLYLYLSSAWADLLPWRVEILSSVCNPSHGKRRPPCSQRIAFMMLVWWESGGHIIIRKHGWPSRPHGSSRCIRYIDRKRNCTGI